VERVSAATNIDLFECCSLLSTFSAVKILLEEFHLAAISIYFKRWYAKFWVAVVDNPTF